MQKKLIDQNKWEADWAIHDARILKPAIDHLLQKYLPKSMPEKTYDCIELGSTPGNNLLYFARTFGYSVTGLDYAGVEKTKQFLNKYSVPCTLIDQDMFKWHSEKKYDVVFSTGVVEHFDPIDTVFDIHKNACKEGGYVIICIPNMRFLNKLVVDFLKPGSIIQALVKEYLHDKI